MHHRHVALPSLSPKDSTARRSVQTISFSIVPPPSPPFTTTTERSSTAIRAARTKSRLDYPPRLTLSTLGLPSASSSSSSAAAAAAFRLGPDRVARRRDRSRVLAVAIAAAVAMASSAASRAAGLRLTKKKMEMAMTKTAYSAPPPPLHRDGYVEVTRGAVRPPPAAPSTATSTFPIRSTLRPSSSWEASGKGCTKKAMKKGPKKKKKKRSQVENDGGEEGSALRTGNEEEEMTKLRLSYRIYRPDLLEEEVALEATGEEKTIMQKKAPLVVVHGGPSLPSQYLYPIASSIPDVRAVIFYDQIGCGRSSIPKELSAYGIPQSVNDLEILIRHLKLERFHLLGHSYGGCLAYEYVKRRVAEFDRTMKGGDAPSQGKVLSVVLSNASTSMRLSDSERTRLLHEIECEVAMRNSSCRERGEEYSKRSATAHELFFRRNQCRTEGDVPAPLNDAFRHVGTVWSGTDAVMDYVATALPSRSPSSSWSISLDDGRGGIGGKNDGDGVVKKTKFPPALIVRGEFDFVTQKCTEGWVELLGAGTTGGDSNGDCGGVREVILGGCAHYCHLEEPGLYGSLIESFCAEHD